ncbi:MAG: repair protein RecN [Frankiales bacterium]|nr:repair protein RecN [Frankiales bacterium]
MLEEIHIRGLGTISDAALEFGPGLTVVTGETGAGKTMIVSGLNLLFGGRADHSRLRPGVAEASVEGRIRIAETELGAAVTEMITAAGGDLDGDGSVVVRRTVAATGRSRAAAGGAAVPAALLARLAESLVVVHGQTDQLRLTRGTEQRATLDGYARLDLSDCRSTFESWRGAVDELSDRQRRRRELTRESELLAHGIAEIEAVAPQPGEDDELSVAAARLEHADALRVAARNAHIALVGDPEDPTGDALDAQTLFGRARYGLQQAAGTDASLDELAARLSGLEASVTDLGHELAAYEAQLDADPARLSVIQDRRSELGRLVRKYGVDVTAVLEWAADARRRLEETDTSDEAIAELQRRCDELKDAYRGHALTLSHGRSGAAEELSRRITAELAGLAMPAARVMVQVEQRTASDSGLTIEVGGRPVGAGADGIDEVELLLQPHPDAPPLAVQRGASGGELSRVMLAVEVVLAGTDPVPTMIFDEIDAGVGGRAGVEVGRRLAALSHSHQVIVVTHLAQVAAFADRHVVVDKTDAAGSDSGVTRTDIREVAGPERIAELARMLAGDDSEAALQHAAELLAGASAPDATGRRGSGNGKATDVPAAGAKTSRRKSAAGAKAGTAANDSTQSPLRNT